MIFPCAPARSVTAMRIGILGTGHVGKAIAAGAAAAGHDVVFGSRTPDTRTDLGHPALPLADAAAGADLVVNALTSNASLPTLTALAAALDGKVLLDIGVDLTAELGLAHPNSSLGEKLQAALPATHVVKSLCTIDHEAMAQPLKTFATPTTIFLSGDDAAAKATVGAFLEDLGWAPEDQLDLGGITTARGQEHFALLFMAVGDALQNYTFNFQLVKPVA
ncbi:NADPH-dependent F420 reductase [Streptomyces sp. NPDC050418]|uniref:NADPH-dependent F420 reductase n=1 Tax=Streptomyces sp. NPDC050418 TaxID=3365612 RepID=UPI0037AD9E7C